EARRDAKGGDRTERPARPEDDDQGRGNEEADQSLAAAAQEYPGHTQKNERPRALSDARPEGDDDDHGLEVGKRVRVVEERDCPRGRVWLAAQGRDERYEAVR